MSLKQGKQNKTKKKIQLNCTKLFIIVVFDCSHSVHTFFIVCLFSFDTVDSQTRVLYMLYIKMLQLDEHVAKRYNIIK